MARRRTTWRHAIAALTAVLVSLALAPLVSADIGVAAFAPTSATAGDTVRVELVGCTHPADDVRIALVPADQADADHATDVDATDTGSAGVYAITVPMLDPGEYGVFAACPSSEAFGYWGSEENLRITGTPDTSTLATAPESASGSVIWGASLLVIAGLVGAAAGLTRVRGIRRR